MADDILNGAGVDDSIFDQFLTPEQQTAAAPTLEGKQPDLSQPNTPVTDDIFDPYIQPELKEAKYDNTEDLAKAFALGLGKGAVGPLAPAALRVAGGDTTAALEREEAHPYATAAGELAGLIGTGAIGKGLGATLGAIGKIAEVGEGASTIAKIGSATAKAAIENAAFQTSDELSKLVLQDPNQSVGSALADIGAAGVLGGALGAGLGSAGALWTAVKGSDTASLLKSIANKAGGIEGASIDDAVQHTLDQSGLELAPELKGALSVDPVFQDIFNTLRQTDTTSAGKSLQKTYMQARQKAADSMIETLGRTPKELDSLSEFSKYESGKELGDILASEYHAQVDPLAKKFEDFRNRYGKVELQPDVQLPTGDTVPGATSQAINKISQLAIDEGWVASPSSSIMQEVNRVVKELPLQKTIKDLGNYISRVGENTADFTQPGLLRAGRMIKDVLKEVEAGAITNKIGITEGIEAVDAFNKTRSAYAIQSGLKDALNDRLHIKGSNTANYAKLLREMAKTDGESIFNRLGGKNDANLLEFLSVNYPKTAEALRRSHVDQVLKKAVDKAPQGMNISGERLAKEIGALSPELKKFITTPEGLNKIQAIGDILDKFNTSPYNFSNTARTMDKLMEYVPSTVTGMVTALLTHNPIMGGLVGALTKLVGKEVPDATKLALLKFMGSSSEISASKFKAAIDFVHSVQKGEAALNKGANGIFKVGSERVLSGWVPSAADRIKLDKVALQQQNDPEALAQSGNEVGHYMPEQGAELSASAARIVSYLANNRPGSTPAAPLDTKMKPSPIEEAQYNKVLDLALNPLILLDKVKNGSVTMQDLTAVKSMYPDLFNRIVFKVGKEMNDVIAKGKQVPYQTRIGVSLLMGQPMDSTMSPAAMAVTNPMPQILPQMPQGASMPKSKGRPSAPELQKLPQAYRTPNEARQQRMQKP